jgi:hypothetical protein
MRSAEAVCSQIDNRSCHIHGETFLFEVQSASMVAGQPGHAILEIAAFQRTASGPALAATVRVTASFDELERVPALLTTALEEWLLRTAAPLTRVH